MFNKMLQSLRTSFAIKNTYRVNTIIYSIKQIPLINRLLPATLYRSKGLKNFANVLAIIWELIATFAGKALYMFAMVFLAGPVLFSSLPPAQTFLHLLLFLTFAGSYLNTYMFNPTNDKYYAMFLLRMDAKLYTLSNYAYGMLKVIVGFLPFALIVGRMVDVPVWICLLIPFFVAAAKIIVAWLALLRYDKTGQCTNENLPKNMAGFWL